MGRVGKVVSLTNPTKTGAFVGLVKWSAVVMFVVKREKLMVQILLVFCGGVLTQTDQLKTHQSVCSDSLDGLW